MRLLKSLISVLPCIHCRHSYRIYYANLSPLLNIHTDLLDFWYQIHHQVNKKIDIKRNNQSSKSTIHEEQGIILARSKFQKRCNTWTCFSSEEDVWDLLFMVATAFPQANNDAKISSGGDCNNNADNAHKKSSLVVNQEVFSHMGNTYKNDVYDYAGGGLQHDYSLNMQNCSLNTQDYYPFYHTGYSKANNNTRNHADKRTIGIMNTRSNVNMHGNTHKHTSNNTKSASNNANTNNNKTSGSSAGDDDDNNNKKNNDKEETDIRYRQLDHINFIFALVQLFLQDMHHYTVAYALNQHFNSLEYSIRNKQVFFEWIYTCYVDWYHLKFQSTHDLCLGTGKQSPVLTLPTLAQLQKLYQKTKP
jgi:hypothetical protein